jgi:hypothetical protein
MTNGEVIADPLASNGAIVFLLRLRSFEAKLLQSIGGA